MPPAQRPSLIRELQRVSRQATIVCCPVDTPEVVEAERQFSAWAQAVSGPRRRLPRGASRARAAGCGAGRVVVQRSRVSAGRRQRPAGRMARVQRARLHLRVRSGRPRSEGPLRGSRQQREPLWRAWARRTTAAFSAHSRRPRTPRRPPVSSTPRNPPDPTDPQQLVRELVTGILGWRQELRERSTREVEATHRHIGELDAALLGFKEAVAEKDAHIGKLDDTLVESRTRSVRRTLIQKLDEHLADDQSRVFRRRKGRSPRKTRACSIELEDQRRSDGCGRSRSASARRTSRAPCGGARATRGDAHGGRQPRTRAASRS